MSKPSRTADLDVPGHAHVAVTGAAGYIGSRLLVELQEHRPGWELTAADNFYRGDLRSVGDVDVEYCDLRQRADLEATLADADVVVHLGAVSGVDDCSENPDRAYEVNVAGTNHVAWHCRKTGTALAFPFSMATIGDPREFPITVEHPRDPLNWYGRTKVLGERVIDTFAEDAFPAHQFMISNLYGSHFLDGREVTKGTVINFFVDRALAGEPLTVYEPGSQARNYVHVRDVARAFRLSAERLATLTTAGETGVEKFTLASDETPSVMAVAELVARVAHEERGLDADVALVENPRSAETTVEQFPVDTTRTDETLGWEPKESVEATVRELIREG